MPTKNYEEIQAIRRRGLNTTERRDSDTLDATLRLGIAVRDARDGLGITQTELANRLGVAQSAVSRIEAGRTNVSVRTLVAIAAGLGLALVLSLGDQEATLMKGGKK